ncbi:C-type mannose receptor 2 isoform X2, partial [Silurus meridionalis]
EYMFQNFGATWTQARTLCQIRYKDLATITSMEENNRYFQLETNSFGSWIGLNKLSGSWKWSGGEAVQEWNHGFDYYPNISENGYDCVLGFDKGLWMKDYCGNGRAFYCYRFLILVKENKTWNEAQEFCRTNYTGLASVTSETSLRQLKLETVETQTENVWTGLRFIDGTWLWVSGEPLGNLVSMPRQCPALPYRCGSLNTTSNTLNKQNCKDKMNFICYWKEYTFINSDNRWSDAVSHCKVYYKDLATITSMEENNRCLKLGANSGNSWIGLCKISGRLGWSDGEPFQQGNAISNNFIDYSNYYCVFMSGSGNWFSSDCLYSTSFYCYRFLILVKENKTWDEAQEFCRTNYTGLASVTSVSSLQQLKLETVETQTENVWTGYSYFGTWTGLRRTSGSWRWSDGGSFLNFNNGANSYIDNPKYDGYCVHTSYQGFWLNDFCWYGKNFYCYRFLILVKENKNWKEAQEYCRTKYTGLASVTSETSLRQLKLETVETQTENVWTGLRFIDGTWLWVSGEPLGNLVSMPRQCPALPYRCGSLNTTSNTLNKQNCNDKLNFICYWKEYIFVDSNVLWQNAQTYCRTYYKDLATITSMEEKISCLESVSGGGYWIGLKRTPDTWEWSDGEQYAFPNWYNGKPFYPNSGYDCGSIATYHPTFWVNYNCKDKRKFLCYRFLILVKENKTWDEAQEFCRTNYTGLASVTSDSSLQQLKLETVETQTENVWTGLQFIDGTWLWVSGEPLGNLVSMPPQYPTFFNWCPGCPSKYVKCVFTNTEGFWNTGFCMNKKGFYCYRFLILVKIKMTWEEAQDYCRAKYTGLASVISEASLQQVIEESAQTQTENVWTGLSFINGIW